MTAVATAPRCEGCKGAGHNISFTCRDCAGTGFAKSVLKSAGALYEMLATMVDDASNHNTGCSSHRFDKRRKEADADGQLPCDCLHAKNLAAARILLVEAAVGTRRKP